MQMKTVDPAFSLTLVSPFLLQALAEVVTLKGFDAAGLCRGLGFGLDDLRDPAQRISYRQIVAAIQRALKLLPDQGLGLWVGARYVLDTLGLLGHVLSLCETLGDALTLAVRYQHTIGGIAVISFEEANEGVMVEVTCRLPFADVQVFAVEEFFASLMVYGRALAGPDFKPQAIECMHAEPCYAPEYLQVLGAVVHFGRQHNRMLLDGRWLKVRLANHDPLAFRQALALLEQQTVQVHEKIDLIQAVERAIDRDLSQGGRLDKIACDLNMSSRTLRRRLAEHDLTFEALLEQIRRGRTLNLLANLELSIKHITEAVGYSDVRCFRRAFQRWTGMSPSAFRNENAQARL